MHACSLVVIKIRKQVPVQYVVSRLDSSGLTAGLVPVLACHFCLSRVSTSCSAQLVPDFFPKSLFPLVISDGQTITIFTTRPGHFVSLAAAEALTFKGTSSRFPPAPFGRAGQLNLRQCTEMTASTNDCMVCFVSAEGDV